MISYQKSVQDKRAICWQRIFWSPHTYIYIYIHVHVYIYTYMYMYIYIYTYISTDVFPDFWTVNTTSQNSEGLELSNSLMNLQWIGCPFSGGFQVLFFLLCSWIFWKKLFIFALVIQIDNYANRVENDHPHDLSLWVQDPPIPPSFHLDLPRFLAATPCPFLLFYISCESFSFHASSLNTGQMDSRKFQASHWWICSFGRFFRSHPPWGIQSDRPSGVHGHRFFPWTREVFEKQLISDG